MDSLLPASEPHARVRELYRLVFDVSLDDFAARSLAVLRTLVRFDSALWAQGRPAEGGSPPLDAIALVDQPPELLTSYERVRRRDRLIRASLERPGQPIDRYALVARRDFVRSAAWREHAARFGLEHALAISIPDPACGLADVLVLWRADAAAPWSPQDLELTQALAPHVIEARRQSLALALRLRAEQGRRIGAGVAACDARGVLHRAEPPALELLRTEWGAWQGAMLPPPLARVLGREASGTFVGERIVVEWVPLAGLRTLRIRPIAAADRLTVRERQVAERLTAGCTNKEIARQLGLEGPTVRSHLYAMHRKLGARSRTQLVRALLEAGIASTAQRGVRCPEPAN